MKLTYRPEIDGLRAVAVGAVILYHAQITIFGYKPFKGGFIGVDIFFVISGYLITSIILKELLTTGFFSFKHFYERRARRILPALLFVMLVSLPFAWIYLMPENLLDYSKSILYSLGFSSNFYFWYSGQQYGAESGLLKPFLHTWSLSVEEQFYILFPIVLLITFKFFRKYLIHILILGFIISLGLADWSSRSHLSFNFYILPTRGWELLAGSILAYFEITNGHRSKNRILNLILPFIGLVLIGHAILFFNDEMFHPSFYTLSPIIGACLIIWFSNKKEITTKILSTKLFVGIGLISYSLYLWHYPVFAISRITEFTQNDIYKKILLGIIIFILSVFSYNFIEKSTRNTKFKFRGILKLGGLIIFCMLTINLYIISNKGEVSFAYKQSKNIYLYNNIINQELRDNRFEYFKNLKNQKFQSKQKNKILIVGDSHSQDLFSAFFQNQNLFKDYEFLISKNYPLSFDNSTEYEDIIKFSNSEIFEQSDKILISNHFNNDLDFKKLDIFLKLLKDKKEIILTSNSNIYHHGKRHGVFTGLTLFDYFLLENKKEKKFIDKNLTFNDINRINNYYYKNRDKKKVDYINRQLALISKKHNIKMLNKEDFQCNISEQICYGVTENGMKIHYDYGHFTIEGAKFFGKKIFELNWFQ